jgi:predicted N-acetyltransferase YhbS
MSVTIRPVHSDDAVRAGTICHDAFKAIADAHRFPPDLPNADVAVGLMHHLIGRPDVYGVVAERDGLVVGSNFLWESPEVGGVGPVTVATDVQNGAVGRRLMNAVIDRAAAQRIPAVRLVQAAYHSRSLSLYAKLGFACREPLATMQGTPLAQPIEGHSVRTATEADLDAANALCREVHGHDRSGELLFAIRQGSARVVQHDRRISGYTTGIGFFGHAVGESTEDVKALIASATSFDGPGFLVPVRNAALFRWCLDQKLRVVQPMTLMSLGLYNDPQGAFLPSILF